MSVLFPFELSVLMSLNIEILASRGFGCNLLQENPVLHFIPQFQLRYFCTFMRRKPFSSPFASKMWLRLFM